MKRLHLLALGATLSGTAGLALAATLPATPDSSAAEEAFARFQAMNGLWSIDGDIQDATKDGEPVDALRSRFRTSAGGSAVLEVLFEDTDHEMLTVYHLEDEELVLTHYCVMGNAPEMVLQPGDDPNVLSFTCRGGANVECGRSKHMHAARFEFAEDGSVGTTWDLFSEGERMQSVSSQLTRE